MIGTKEVQKDAQAENEDIQTLVPQDLNAEAAVLGAMLLDEEAVETAREVLTGADFYHTMHKEIFEAMVTLAEGNVPIDLVTARNELTRRGTLDYATAQGLVLQLSAREFTIHNARYYADIVKACSVRRALMDGAQTIYHAAREGGQDVDTLLTNAAQTVETCGSDAGTATGWKGTKSLLNEAWDRIDDKRKEGGRIPGMSTGLVDIDSITGGMKPGQLWIIAARPAMGKTGLGITMSINAAIQGNITGVFSCEMTEDEIMDRVLAGQASVDSRAIENGKLTDDQYNRLMDAQQRVYDMPWFIDDTPAPSVSVLETRAKKLRAEQGGLDLIVVDYIQRLKGPDGGARNRGGNRTEEVTEIARALKTMARRLQCPVIALSQLNRGVEKREDKRPQLSDLYESGGIEAEADKVCFLYRPSYYEAKEEGERVWREEERDPTEFIVAKNRNGRTGFVKIGFAPRFVRFDNLAEEQF